MKFSRRHSMEKHRGEKVRNPLSYDKMTKGVSETLDNVWDSSIHFFFEENNKVWKPNEKGIIGRFEMKYKIPIFKPKRQILYLIINH